jgi:hypothetical protein
MGAGLRRSLKGGAKPKRRTRKTSRKGGMLNIFNKSNDGQQQQGIMNGLGNMFNGVRKMVTPNQQPQPPPPYTRLQQYGGRKRRGKKRSRDSHTRKRRGAKTRKTHGTRRRR